MPLFQGVSEKGKAAVMESQGIFQIYPMFTGRAGKHSVGRVLRGEKNRSSENCGFCFGSGSCGPVGSSAHPARTLRVSLCACGAQDWVTVGTLSPCPCQGTEFPGPSTFRSKPCGPVGSSARSARTLRVSLCACGRAGWGTLGGPPPKTQQETAVPFPPPFFPPATP